MNKNVSKEFAKLMIDYLDVPECVGTMIENQLIKNQYEEVIKYVVKRKHQQVKDKK